MKFKRIVWGMFVLLCGTACQKEVAQRERVVPVKVVHAVARDVPIYIDSFGTCVARDSIDIVPLVSGEITGIYFEPGHSVEKGQLLYTIDARPYEAIAMQANGQLQMAQAKLEMDRLQLARSRELLVNQYISQQEYDSLQAAVSQDEGQLQVANGNLQQARLNVDHCSIRSPVRGMAGYEQNSVGNIVTATISMAMSSPLLSIQTLDLMYVEFSISENEFPKVYEYFQKQQGLDCEVTLIANESVKARARLTIIDNHVSKHSGNVKLRALLDNGNSIFWPGESVRVRLILSTLPSAILAPEAAVSISQSGKYVFIVEENGYAEVRPVTVGQLHGTDVVFFSGLEEGDRVVVAGQFLLTPHTKVIIDGESSATPPSPPITMEKREKIQGEPAK